MRHQNRLVATFVTLGWLLVSSAYLTAASAALSAVTGCLSSGACATVTYTGDTRVIPFDNNNYYGMVVFDWHVAVTGGDISTAVLRTHQDPNLPVTEQFPPEINGKFAAPNAVTQHGGDVAIDLAQALPTPSGAGIDVRYVARVIPRGGALSSYVSLSFDDFAHHGPATSVSAPAIRRIDLPDLEVSTQGTSLKVPRGMTKGLGFGIVNHARHALPLGTELVLQFPPGFALGNGGVRSTVPSYDRPRCRITGVRRWTCDQPHASTFTAVVDVAADATTAAGTTGRLTIQAYPFGPDANAADNIRSVALKVIGIADLTARVQQPASSTIALGSPRTVTAVISNAGPDVGNGLSAFVSVTSHYEAASGFAILGVGGSRWRPGQSQQYLGLAQLAPGRSVTISFQVTGTRVGAAAAIAVAVLSESFDPNSHVSGSTAIVNVEVAAATEIAIPRRSANPTLPATGVGAAGAAIVGATLLVLGIGLSFAGRRRNTHSS